MYTCICACHFIFIAFYVFFFVVSVISRHIDKNRLTPKSSLVIQAGDPVAPRCMLRSLRRLSSRSLAMTSAFSPDAHLSAARDLLSFIDASPSPFHAVEEAKAMLVAAGFQQLDEREAWAPEQNGKYFMTRNNSTLVAFAVGGRWVRAGRG